MSRVVARWCFLVAGLVCWSACGPGGGTYCQSGPKYGTQCYSRMDLQAPGSPPPPADDGRPR